MWETLREFRLRRISFALPPISKLSALCGEEANPHRLAVGLRDGLGRICPKRESPERLSQILFGGNILHSTVAGSQLNAFNIRTEFLDLV